MPRTRNGVRVNRTKKAGITEVAQIYLDERPHYCSCCGAQYDKLQGHFTNTRSALFAGNGGYTTICNSCRDGYYDQLFRELGNDEAAIERMCLLFDLPYVPSIISYDEKKDGRSKIASYIIANNLAQHNKEKTYTDTYKKTRTNRARAEIAPDAIKLFGRQKYTPEDYDDLMGYLQDVIDCYGEPKDSQMLSNYATLASLEYQRVRAGKTSPKDLTEIVRQRLELIKALGLKPKTETRNAEELGSLIRSIEQYAPAEFFSDKKKYRDFFGIGKYIERFIIRPMRNMMTGTRDEDPEYFVKDEDDDDA